MMTRFRKILAPLDMGEIPVKALDIAHSIARERGATICLLHVVPTDELHLLRKEYRADEGGGPDEAWARKVAAEHLDRIAGGRRTEQVRYDPLVVTGRPAARIVEVARDEGSDLIVISGRRAESRLREWLLGSTTYEVVRRASCDVLVVR